MIRERETERASGSEAEPKHSLFRKKGKGREEKRREKGNLLFIEVLIGSWFCVMFFYFFVSFVLDCVGE